MLFFADQTTTGMSVPTLLVTPARLTALGIENTVFRMRKGFRYILRASLYFLLFDGPTLSGDESSNRVQCKFLHTNFSTVAALTKYVCDMATPSGYSFKPFNRIQEPIRGTANEVQVLLGRSMSASQYVTSLFFIFPIHHCIDSTLFKMHDVSS
jgi:hypothetical protein